MGLVAIMALGTVAGGANHAICTEEPEQTYCNWNVGVQGFPGLCSIGTAEVLKCE